jgi:hypothetical protein
MIDQTGSMVGERDQLKADLTTGDFINDSSFQCSDYDFDFKPNNELKTQGIIGAVRCMIRDANFGMGYFREIPLGSSAYGSADSITYRNVSDITASIPTVAAGIATLTTIGNYDWPEASMLALYAMATGNGYYFGTNRTGLAPRTDCPSLTYGYPCFRNSAIPIVLMFTDAQFHNGPSNNDYPYSSSQLGITKGTTTTYTPVKGNETYASAYDLGDVSSSFTSYIGSTTGMASDFGASLITCGSTDGTSPDAMFKFTLASTKTVKATTEGSDFDTTLSIFRGMPSSATTLPTYPNTNDTGATAYSFGDVSSKYVVASGSSSTLVADYSPNDVACSAAASAKDATFSFTLASPTRVALDTAGSSYTGSVALFSGTPVTTTYTAVTGNDNILSATQVGKLDGKNLGFSGDTSAAAIKADYTAAQLNCSSAPADTANDVVYAFTLAQNARVRVSTEDSSLKSVIALTNAGPGYVTPTAVANTNELEASAYAIGAPAALDGLAFQYTGSTASMVANYAGSLTGCGSGDSSKDAVYKFTLANPATVQLDTSGSPYDTVLSLFRTTVGTGTSTVALSGKAYETGATAWDLGTVNARTLVTSGGSTSTMVADYSATQIGCSASSNAPDAVFKFHLDNATTVRLDTAGSAYDTVVSLHSSPLPDQTVTTIATNNNDTVATARQVDSTSSAAFQSLDGTSASLNADVPVDNAAGCAANSGARDAVFQLNVGTAGSYEINTVGSAFDTVLGVYPSTVYNPSPPTASAQGANGDTKAAAVSVGALNGRWVSYTGSTATLKKDNSFSTCSANSASNDAYYAFTLSSAATVVIDTVGSAFDTVLALYTSADGYVNCNDNLSTSTTASQLTASLSAGSYYVFIKGKISPTSGNYQITFRDSAVSTTTNLLQCDDNGGGGTASKVTATLAVGTYYVIVKGKAAADKGSYRLTVKANDLINAANRIACDNDSSTGTTSRIDQALGAGDYYVVVSGTSSSAKGNFVLKVTDLTDPPGFVTCNDDYGGALTSYLSHSLDAGTYYVVVKGYSSASGSYTLNIKDTNATPTSTYQCDYNSGPSGTSLIERDLTAGDYRVIVKGKTVTDKGAYKLILRDLTQVPTKSLGCDHGGGTSGASHLESDLAAGTYTVVLKSDSTSGAGAYKLSVRDASRIVTSDTSVACDNDSGLNSTSSISTSLTAGTYYALVKGYKGSYSGTYQLNIGAGSTSTGTSFTPPTWAQTLAALQAKSVRVMPILSCHDDPLHGDVQGDCVATRNQAKTLANGTGALGSTLKPLVYDIDGDGGGLSKSVVQGIGQLANYLEMNVSARVVFDPDANPGFAVSVKAVDQPGDGCSGLVGIEHQHCLPGATPRFEIQFNNPVNAPVPLNSKDPNGGYNFRAELIGDSQFIVDKVPIYIIPRDVDNMTKAVPKVATNGSYWQDLTANNCVGTQRPDWRDLTWNALVPDGTSVSFSVCASDKASDLATCTPTPLCTVTGGAACTTDTNCPNGYCSAQKNCQQITGRSCNVNADCASGSTCISSKCVYTGQPVYAGAVLGSGNYTSNLRMKVGLTANTTANTAPTVNDWSLSYLCNTAL